MAPGERIKKIAELTEIATSWKNIKITYYKRNVQHKPKNLNEEH